jgi:hypothetical protein
MFVTTIISLSIILGIEHSCYIVQPVQTKLAGTLACTAMNDSQMLTGVLDGKTNQMVVWKDSEIVTQVSGLYESFGVLINDQGIAAGLGNNGILQDDRLIRADANGSYEILATITGSGGWSSLTAMNEQGSIVGNYSGGSGSSDWQPFVWTDEDGLVFLGSGKATAYARDIDHNNVITGLGEVDGTYHAMLWEDGVQTDLAVQFGLEGSSSGWYFDEQGRVLISEYMNLETRFRWYDLSDSSFEDVYTFPSGSYTMRVVTSKNGRVAFSWSTFELGVFMARWSSAEGVEFATLDINVVIVTVVGINNQGQVIYESLSLPVYDSIAMVWSDGVEPTSLHDFVPSDPFSTFARSINNQGDILVKADASNWILQLGCTGDIDHDGEVGVNDLLTILGLWGTEEEPCGADLDASGTVDVGDILTLIDGWGACE